MTAVAPEDARRAHRALQAIWMIVSARTDDALARDVARLGERLRAAIDAGDWDAAGAVIEDTRAWLSTMAGVVTARLTRVFEAPLER